MGQGDRRVNFPMSTPEGEFKQSFNVELKKLGCEVVPYVQGAYTRKGFPDYIVLLPEGLTVYIEYKASKNAKYRPGQREWLEKLRKMGYFAWACYPENKKEVLKEIKELI